MTTSSPSFPGIWSFYGQACVLLKKHWKNFAVLSLLSIAYGMLTIYILEPQPILEKIMIIGESEEVVTPVEFITANKAFFYQVLAFLPFLLFLSITFFFQIFRVVAIEKAGQKLHYFERFWSWFGANILSVFITAIVAVSVFLVSAFIGASISSSIPDEIAILAYAINLFGVIIMTLFIVFFYTLFSPARLLPLARGLGVFAACKNSPKIITIQWKFALWKYILFAITTSFIQSTFHFVIQISLFFMMVSSSQESLTNIFSGINIVATVLIFLMYFVTLVLLIAGILLDSALIDRAEKLGVKIQ